MGYASFESLLLTDRAVRRRGNWLFVRFAGDTNRGVWLEFDDKKTAKLAGGSLLVHVREKRVRGEVKTDYNYNQTVMAWTDRLRAGGYVRNANDCEEQKEAQNEGTESE